MSLRGAAIAAVLAGVACGAREPGRADASFVLGFWADAGDGEPFPLGAHSVLGSGARLEMVLETDGSCDVYVLHRDSRGGIAVLHPPAGKGPRAAGVFEPIPAGARLDSATGLETFHVIASEEPLDALARAVAGNSGALPDALQETRRLHERAGAPAPAPALIAGRVVRADPPAFRHRVATVLCQTFTIDHR